MLVGNPLAIGPNGERDEDAPVQFTCPGCSRPFASPSRVFDHITHNRGHVGPGIKVLLFSTCQLPMVGSIGARYVYVSDVCADLDSGSDRLSFLGDHEVPQGIPEPVRCPRHAQSTNNNAAPPSSAPLQPSQEQTAGGRKRKQPTSDVPNSPGSKRGNARKRPTFKQELADVKLDMLKFKKQQQKNYDKAMKISDANWAVQDKINKKQARNNKSFMKLFHKTAKHVGMKI